MSSFQNHKYLSWKQGPWNCQGPWTLLAPSFPQCGFERSQGHYNEASRMPGHCWALRGLKVDVPSPQKTKSREQSWPNFEAKSLRKQAKKLTLASPPSGLHWTASAFKHRSRSQRFVKSRQISLVKNMLKLLIEVFARWELTRKCILNARV